MKKMKKMMCLLLAAVMVLSVGFAVNGTEAKAAEERTPVPKAARCGVGRLYTKSVIVPLTSKTGDVKNIKVYKGKKKTKNLVVTRVSKNAYESDPTVTLRLYAKKSGKYTVKYNVYADGKKVGKARKLTVYAKGYGWSGVESVKINKKNVMKFKANYSPAQTYYTSKNSLKMNFKVAKGCKIKKIEMITLGKDGKEVVKKIKNNKKVKLGQYGRKYSYSDGSWEKAPYAVTTFRVSYVDNYSSNKTYVHEDEYEVYKKAKKWVTPVYDED